MIRVNDADVRKAAQLAKRRIGILAASKAERKSLGIASATKKSIEEVAIFDAVCLAVAKTILRAPISVYSRDVRSEFNTEMNRLLETENVDYLA